MKEEEEEARLESCCYLIGFLSTSKARDHLPAAVIGLKPPLHQ